MADPTAGRPLEALTTEQRQAGRQDLDRRSTVELAHLMNEQDASVPGAVAAALPAIVAAVDAIAGRLEGGGRLVYVGAGSAGRLGVLDASECGPTFNVRAGQVVALIAGGAAALTAPVEGAEDDAEAGARDLAALGLGAQDAVVAITASGRTPYVLGAARYGAEVGALTVGLSCNAGAALSALVRHPIEIVVGPELIAGSTRLKAGTAQKLALNMLSTITMIRLGKTFGDLMVDLQPTNGKLRDRAQRIVAQAAQVEPGQAAGALAAADGDVKIAVVMLRLGLDRPAAAARLVAAQGHLRRALAAPR